MRVLNRLRVVALACVASLSMHTALAQTSVLPRNIRLVVPFPPGNAADIQARALGDQLRKSLGLSVVVDNRPGASGAIALQHVAMAKPDGATLLVGSLSPLVVTPATNKALPYDTERDFALNIQRICLESANGFQRFLRNRASWATGRDSIDPASATARWPPPRRALPRRLVRTGPTRRNWLPTSPVDRRTRSTSGRWP